VGRNSAGQKLKTVLAVLEKTFGRRERYKAHPPVEQCLVTLLLKDGRDDGSVRAIRRLERKFVDWNEVRVCSPEVLDGLLGKHYPPGTGRLICDTLTGIFNYSQAMNLDDIVESDPGLVEQRLRKIRPMPSRVCGELLMANFGCRTLPESAGLLRVMKRTHIVGRGTTTSNTRTIRRMVSQPMNARVFHAFETLAERICTEEDFDCRACPINEHCPTGIDKLEKLRIREEKEQAAREAEEKRLHEKHKRERRAKARRSAETRKLKQAIKVRSKKLKISTRPKPQRKKKKKKDEPAVAAHMVQSSSDKVKPSRKKKRRTRKSRRRS